jgi:hypothetical protein
LLGKLKKVSGSKFQVSSRKDFSTSNMVSIKVISPSPVEDIGSVEDWANPPLGVDEKLTIYLGLNTKGVIIEASKANSLPYLLET